MRFTMLPLVLSVVAISGCSEGGGPVGASLRVGPGRNPGLAEIPGAVPAHRAEPTGVLSLQQALDLALEHSLELKASSLDISAAAATRLQADLRPNPELEVEVEEVGGTGNRSGFGGAETTIGIAQPIEMGHKRTRRVTLASLEKELAEWDHKARQLDVTKEVTESFAAVLAWQERLSLAEEIVRIAEKAHEAVSQRVKAGKDSPIEQTKSSVALATARIEPRRARRALASARKRLAATWGAKVVRFDSVTGNFYEITLAPPSDDLSLLVHTSPDVARWETELKKARAALELERARATSDVTLSGGYRYFDEDNDSAVVLGLSMPLPISDRNQGGIRRATYLLARAEQSGRAAEIRILAALDEAAQRLASAYTEAGALKNDVLPGAQSSFDAVSEGYRDGKFDYLQVLDAQRTLFETKSRYIESLDEYHKARGDVERLIGENLEDTRNNRGSKSETDK